MPIIVFKETVGKRFEKTIFRAKTHSFIPRIGDKIVFPPSVVESQNVSEGKVTDVVAVLGEERAQGFLDELFNVYIEVTAREQPLG